MPESKTLKLLIEEMQVFEEEYSENTYHNCT